jgi:hypothetical protein
MGTLHKIIFTLKNELSIKYGYNKIFLKEYMNSDDTLGISIDNGLSGEIFGEVILTENGWELRGVNYEIFESQLEFIKHRETSEV